MRIDKEVHGYEFTVYGMPAMRCVSIVVKNSVDLRGLLASRGLVGLQQEPRINNEVLEFYASKVINFVQDQIALGRLGECS